MSVTGAPEGSIGSSAILRQRPPGADELRVLRGRDWAAVGIVAAVLVGIALGFLSRGPLWLDEAQSVAIARQPLDHLAAAGLPVPAPVAARYVRNGMSYRADLIVRRIPGVETLAERLARGALDAALGERVGATLARFHAAGACHADLNAHNILLDARNHVALIDFDRGSLRKPALSWQQSNLARLRRSLVKLGAMRRFDDFDTRFWHPLLGAYHAGIAKPPVVAAMRGGGR